MRRAPLLALLLAAAPSQAQPAAPAPLPAAAPATPAEVAIFRVYVAPGIDPSLSDLVARQLGNTTARMGLRRSDPAATDMVARRFGASGPLGPDRAAELVRASGARVGVFAAVRAEAGRYRVRVEVVPASGATPLSEDVSGVSIDLYREIDRALGVMLPRALLAPGPAPAHAAEPPAPEGRFRLALGTEAAFGISGGDFRNHLVGPRADYRFSPGASLGLAVQYANLKGKDGRAHDWLPWAMFEYRIDLGSDWAVPLRYATGYLPKNGPVVHGAAGLAIPVGDDLDLTFELIAPTVWITHERTVVSADVGVELAYTP